jgi:hypothetical protein
MLPSRHFGDLNSESWLGLLDATYGYLEKYRCTLEAPIETHVLAVVGLCQ